MASLGRARTGSREWTLDRKRAAERPAVGVAWGTDAAFPADADWAWRPNPWATALSHDTFPLDRSGRRLSADTEVFHDAARLEARIEQLPQRDGPGIAERYAVSVTVGEFAGSYLSLALECPPEGLTGLGRRHLIGAALDLHVDTSMMIFARCNLRHGPNTETLVREVPQAGGEEARHVVEFDLAYTDLNEKRVEAAWLDLILQVPARRHLLLRDLVIYRRPRAEL
jgi:hypothetical protein